jgi:hypothetical protein
MTSYASLDEAFGGSYGTKKGTNIKDANKVYNSATRRTESALEEHADAIKSLTSSLPIAGNDEDAVNNYAPARINGTRSGTNQIEPFSVRDYKPPAIPGSHGFAYSPIEPTSDTRGDWDARLDRLVRKMERSTSGGETSTHDLLLYIFTGVFMLFVLDTFVQIGKRSK